MSRHNQRNFLAAVVIGLVLLIPSLTLATATSRAPKLEWQEETTRVLAQIPKSSQSESLSFEIGEPRWKLGFSNEEPDNYRIAEYIREEDDIKNWHELLTIQNFVLKPQLGSPEEMFNRLKKTREKECPGTTRWNIIDKNEKSILYEWQAQPCLGWANQHEVARIIDGQYNRFLIRYTVKVDQLEPSQRAQWIERLSKAKIIVKEAPSGDPKFTWTEEILDPPKELENMARETIFQSDQKVAPNCQTREVVKIIRETPVLLEEGAGYRLLHHLERWDIKRCDQLVSYLAWYTFDDIHQEQSPRVITGPLAEAQEFAEKQPALRELLQYKPH